MVAKIFCGKSYPLAKNYRPVTIVNMKHELAKELDDAGFPQKMDYGHWFYSSDGSQCGFWGHGEKFAPPRDAIKVPTLDELIEACRPYFWDLVCNVGIRRGDVVIQEAEWVADARIDNITATGDTPAEAVAHLWLAIHKR